MAFHIIKFGYKENIDVPEEHMKALEQFVDELGNEFYLFVDKDGINLKKRNWCWVLEDEIDFLIKEDAITLGMINAYRWLREHTYVESLCHNACDNEYGPDSWADIECDLERFRDKINEIETRLSGEC